MPVRSRDLMLTACKCGKWTIWTSRLCSCWNRHLSFLKCSTRNRRFCLAHGRCLCCLTDILCPQYWLVLFFPFDSSLLQTIAIKDSIFLSAVEKTKKNINRALWIASKSDRLWRIHYAIAYARRNVIIFFYFYKCIANSKRFCVAWIAAKIN